ncbi:phage tail tape-measure protein [Rhizobium sp. RCC_161_2]|uniref:phage tail tape-measure protein n=1 Tax=Rhizobium sp. RCC_161_2 TaxID=3239219 RepID=UPI003524095C
MTDVATLSLVVAISSVSQAIVEVDNLSGASKRAQGTVAGLEGASRRAAGAASAAAAAYEKQGKAALKASTQVQVYLSAISQNANGSPASKQVENYADSLEKSKKSASDASKEATELASSLIDVAKAAGNGDSVLKILADKGPGIAKSLGSEGAAGGLKKLGAAFLSVISPTSLLAAAVTGLIAIGVQMVDWPKLAETALKGLARILQAIAPYALLAAAGLALVYAPAILAGLAAVPSAILTITSALWSLAMAIYATVGLPVLLVAGFVAIVAAAVIFRDELTKYLGVDIVGAAKTGVNFIIGSFVAAYHDIEILWSNFPDIIVAAATGAANAAIGATNSIIQSGIDGINALIRGLQQIMSFVGADKAAQYFGFSGTLKELDPFKGMGPISDGGAADRLRKVLDDRNEQIQKDLNADHIGNIVTNIGQATSTVGNKFKEIADGFTKSDRKAMGAVSGAGQVVSRPVTSAPTSDSYGSIVADANKRIASLQEEQAALGMTEQAAAKMRYETELLNKAQEKNIALTPEQKTELGGLAAEMASVEAATKSAREAMDFAKDLTKGFISDLKSGLKNGESFWKSFSTAAVNALNKIADKLLNDVLDSLFKVNSAASGGGGGGFLSGLLGILGFGGGSGGKFDLATGANAPIPIPRPTFANGGYTGPGGKNEPAGIVHAGEVVWSQKDIARAGGVGIVEAMRLGRRGYADGGVVGEGGPQLVRAQPDAPVPVRRLRADNQNDASGSASGVHVTVGVSVDEDGNLKAYVKNVAQSEAQSSTRQGLSDFNQQLPDRVAQINRNPRRR